MNKHFESIGRMLLVALVLFFAGFVQAQEAKYSVVITLDGLRPDAISKSNAPNIKLLMKGGSYSLEAITVIPSRTIPAHTSLVTGLSPQRHGMTLNRWMPSMGYVSAETIFSIAKKHGLKTAMFVGKDKLEYLAKPGSVDHFESTGESLRSIEEISSRFSSYVKAEKPELIFVHFPEPDLTGHKAGWMSKEYIKSFEDVDRAIGEILSSLQETGIYDDTFIVITADHGGHGKDHGSSNPHDMTIPWIAFGKGVMKGHKIREKVFIYDTAPTVLFALGMETPPLWDGQPIKEIFMNKKNVRAIP
ncbi:MAG: ectonucleotide pyrophosphatase/phosphodiesterase [Thermodesulfobacteriota bacterium]